MDNNEKTFDNLHYIRGNEEYEVRGWIYWNKNTPILHDEKKDNTEEVVFVFERMNHGLWLYVENNILSVNYGYCEADVMLTYDFVKLKHFIIRWMLKKWNLPMELKRKQNGELTEETYDMVLRVHPNIMRYFIEKFENTIFLSETDRKEIMRQSALLFHPKSKGVNNPHEAISLYCNLSGFWEKFGLNWFDMQRIPHDLFTKLKTVLNSEISIKTSEMENTRRQIERNKNSKRKM